MGGRGGGHRGGYRGGTGADGGPARKFDDAARARLLQALRTHAHHGRACDAAGVSTTCVDGWIRRDAALAEAVGAARREGVRNVLRALLDEVLAEAGGFDRDLYRRKAAALAATSRHLASAIKDIEKTEGLPGAGGIAAPARPSREALEVEIGARLDGLAARLRDGETPGAGAFGRAFAGWPGAAGAREDWRAVWALAARDGRSLARRSTGTLARWAGCWPLWAHEGQLPPAGDWTTWLLMAGRGFGKTRAGAEWVGRQAAADGALRVALVGATEAEVRAVMAEGRSGLMEVGAPGTRPRWLRGALVWPSGAQGFVYSGASPEGLRGPEHHLAWCDEIAKWARAEETWSNLQLGLRLGARPRVLVTTTPRPTPLMRRLLGDPRVARTGGASGANRHLPPAFLHEVERLWGGTRLGRQELGGEMLDDVPGTLWPRDLLERCRIGSLTPMQAAEWGFVRVVVGVDPPASAGGDACGIVAAGLEAAGRIVVLEDASVAGLSPEGWARATRGAAERWGADRIAAEANQGGDMVLSVLEAGAEAMPPVRLVHATRGKKVRAEPVAARYERGRVAHAGVFPALEDELAGFTPRGYEGPGRSPDRADALVWAVTELAGAEAAEPRVRAM